jgi:hypothetical protein
MTHQCDFTNLTIEIGRLVMAEELFTFVLEPGVKATNNGREGVAESGLGAQSGPYE